MFTSKYMINLSRRENVKNDETLICQEKIQDKANKYEKNQEDKMENVDYILEDFQMELSMELTKIRGERSKELNNFHQNINKLMSMIENKENSYLSDIERFYDEKELKIGEINQEINDLKTCARILPFNSIKEKISYMKNKLKCDITNILFKDNFFEAHQFINELKTGTVVLNRFNEERIGLNLGSKSSRIGNSPLSVTSIESSFEYSTELDEYPSIIVSNNDGFYGLTKDEIIHLDTKEVLYYPLKAMDFNIRDLTVTEKGQICFLSRRKDQSKSDSYNYIIDTLDKSPLFLHIVGHNQSILLSEKVGKTGENIFCFFPKNEILIHNTNFNYFYSFKKGMSVEFITDLKVKDNIIYVLQSEFDVRYYNVFSQDIIENFIGKRISVFLINQQLLLKEYLINKLKGGHFLLTNKEMIFIVDPYEKKLIALPQKNMFRNGYLRCYRFIRNEIIFCIQNLSNMNKLTFKYFPL
ncbi:unnamed protein product [Dimorphilus gyrociliatus]|uniref:Uncharacterized protein n=1 Tax=Dimorphilus gyrociliatus TaxID=2664684 RepID=A0A7I8VF96_9ANNE|nr:unnamed protein product [Dimorphilus gyrociliatus]